MDLTTARLEVRERLGELTADFFTDVEVDRAINDAVKHFSNEERWPWLLTEGTDSLPETEDTFELPDGIGVNRFLALSAAADDAQPLMLERVDARTGFNLRNRQRETTSHPRFYYVTSASFEPDSEVRYVVRFVPGADQDYALTYLYYRVPEEASTGGTDLDVPEEYREVVPSWASGKLFLKEFQISEKANEQFSLYAVTLEQARKDVGERSGDEVQAVGRSHPREQRVPGGRWDRFTGPLG